MVQSDIQRPSALKQININILTENRREINHGLITNVNLPEKTIGNLKENLKRKGPHLLCDRSFEIDRGLRLFH
jgi:hypothetical protein